MWHFKCSTIKKKNIKKKMNNTSKLNINFWPQLYSPMCAHEKRPQTLPLHISPPALLLETASGVATQDTGPRPAQPQTSLQAVPFLWPMGTLENGLPQGQNTWPSVFLTAQETPYHQLLE
jgi:hypothetical protein